jgi:hypothetical protein
MKRFQADSHQSGNLWLSRSTRHNSVRGRKNDHQLTLRKVKEAAQNLIAEDWMLTAARIHL